MQTVAEAENDLSFIQLHLWMEEIALREKLNACRNSADPRYLILDLVVGDYSPQRLVSYAAEDGNQGILGYIADIALQELPAGIASEKLEAIVATAKPSSEWERLSLTLPPGLDAYFKMVADETNRKWRVYASMPKGYLADWFELYSNELRQAQHINK